MSNQRTPSWARLQKATPNYQGGKRKLAPAIFQAIEAALDVPPERATLLDGFAGAGSISMYGKLRGFKVISNDMSIVSESITRALVENSHVQLTDDDIALALTTPPTGWYMPPVEHLLWPEEARQMVAGILTCAETYERPAKKWLLRAMAVHTAMRVSAWGQPRRMTVGRKLRERRYSDLTPGQAQSMHYMTESFKVAQDKGRSMKGVVFSNGRQSEVHRRDVLELLPEVTADVAYLDPPYPGTASYESSYIGLSALLENRPLDAVNSRFSKDEGWKFLGDVFDAAGHIPMWVLSMHNSVVSVEQLTALMEDRGRTVTAQAYEHEIFGGSLAGAAKAQANREFVLIAKA